MDIKTGYFQSDGLAVNVILGFVPDFLLFYEDFKGATAPYVYMWQKAVADLASTGQYGFVDASTGDWIACADANNGIIAFDQSGNYVMVESPIPGIGKKATVVQNWAVGITPVARSATVIGTILRPTTKNGYVYECTTLTGIIAGAEPTWPTTPGVTVTDADSNVWTCRNEEVCRGGGKGFTIGATIQTDAQYCWFIAFRSDKNRYLGDAAEGDLSII